MSYDYRYAKKWRLERERGITRYIDPAPTVAHVNQLLTSGVSKRSIAEAAGVSPTLITSLTRHKPKHITRRIAAQLLAVRVEHGHDREAPRGFVPAIGVRRRIRALQAIGHSAATIADAAGVTLPVIHNICNQAGDWVTAINRDAVHRAYEQLWSTPGASAKTRGWAQKHGWAPPMAWDDDTIDDPSAKPAHLLKAAGPQPLDEAAIVRRVDGDHTVQLTHDERREVVRRLHSQGLNDGEIERTSGISSRQILRDRQRLNLSANADSGRNNVTHKEGTAA